MKVLRVTPRLEAGLARTLLGIQHEAYACEAALIGDDRIPALHENLDDLQAVALLWFAAFVDRRLVGAVGWNENSDGLDIGRLIVMPEMHRRGVGSALIQVVLQRAGKRRTVVSTGRDNTPARSMYEHLEGLSA